MWKRGSELPEKKTEAQTMWQYDFERLFESWMLPQSEFKKFDLKREARDIFLPLLNDVSKLEAYKRLWAQKVIEQSKLKFCWMIWELGHEKLTFRWKDKQLCTSSQKSNSPTQLPTYLIGQRYLGCLDIHVPINWEGMCVWCANLPWLSGPATASEKTTLLGK